MEFPTALIHAETGRIEETDIGIAIEVPLKPFELPLEDSVEIVSTSIRMEGVPLPSGDLDDLQNQTFQFPRNPEPGYIDASMYIEHAHHPIDVTVLRFGRIADGTMSLDIEGTLCFEFEGLDEYRNTDFSMTATLRSAAGER
ncbi:hypothetical protein [Sphingosinicella sp.]|uniref:hypothetical protein n=1 Tax=Sphingosinicella sp. TaxID=1917971 RepID=UPI004037EE09